MFALTILALFVATFVIFASLVLNRKLRETEAELERTRARMARLDETIEQMTARELAAETEREATPRYAPPAELTTDDEDEEVRERVDSGRFIPVGLAMDTDAFEDEVSDDFAAPRFGIAVDDSVDEPEPARRERLDTPVVTPRTTLPPGSQDSVVEVGSIQVSSEALRDSSK